MTHATAQRPRTAVAQRALHDKNTCFRQLANTRVSDKAHRQSRCPIAESLTSRELWQAACFIMKIQIFASLFSSTGDYCIYKV
eukprot:4825504-Pleurochrysis_carterae.AAC.6